MGRYLDAVDRRHLMRCSERRRAMTALTTVLCDLRFANITTERGVFVLEDPNVPVCYCGPVNSFGKAKVGVLENVDAFPDALKRFQIQ